MFDLEAIERRHAAGNPAAKDIRDLIAEVKRLQQPTKDKAEFYSKALEAGRMTKEEVRKAESLRRGDEPTEENTKP